MKLHLSFLALATSLSSFAQAADCNLTPNSTNATVTIEEYADLECPYCRQGADLISRAQTEFGSHVKIIFRTMPLKFHAHGRIAALATHAVCEQGAALGEAFINALFEKQADLVKEGEPFLYRTAEAIGADRARLKADIESPRVIEAVAHDEALAKAAGVTGTPSFVIIGAHGRETIVGAVDYSEFKAAIARQE